ncbi:MAG: HAD-IA family hydrolase [Burkholderiaceae bacterium]|nr:HAD-IA family hydrolase [Burkholderiaceae bacterium]
MPAPALRALLWDVDGTVAETERDGHRVAFNQAFEAAGLPWHWDVAHYGTLLQVTGGRERLLADMADRPDAPTRAEDREALARHLHVLKNERYARRVEGGAIAARAGVLETMRAAHAAGLRQAIVTTTSRRNVQALFERLLGPDWHMGFDALCCGEDTQRKKPDPEVYLLALRRLGLAPAEALAIEDSPPGARAACAAAVPLLLRPSVYFPSTRLPDGLVGWLCPAAAPFDLDHLHRAHAALTASSTRP